MIVLFGREIPQDLVGWSALGTLAVSTQGLTGMTHTYGRSRMTSSLRLPKLELAVCTAFPELFTNGVSHLVIRRIER